MFICNHCPYVKAVEDRLIRLAREFGPRGVAVRRRLLERRRDLSRRRLRQAGRALAREGLRLSRTCTTRRRTSARAFGAVCTPDIFVYDRDRRLAYRGRIDDSWKDESKVTRRELADGDRGAAGGQAPVAPSSGRRWGARSNGDRRREQAAAARSGATAREDPKAPWRAYLQRKGLKTTQQREAIVDAFLRTSGHVALEDLLSSRAAQAPARRAGDGLPHGQAARGGGHRGGAPLRAGADAVRGRRGAGPPRPPDLRQLRLHHRVRERRDRGSCRTRPRAGSGFNVLRHRHELFGLCEKARGIAGRALPGRNQRSPRSLVARRGQRRRTSVASALEPQHPDRDRRLCFLACVGARRHG